MNKPPKVAIFQHTDHSVVDMPGLLKPLGFEAELINLSHSKSDFDKTPSGLNKYASLIFMGGAMSLTEIDHFPSLKEELSIIKEALSISKPILGICLGAQLLAKALGSQIYKGRNKEIGWYDITLTLAAKKDPVFSGFAKNESVFQWHGDSFDLPKGAENLAQSTLFDNQAFCYGSSAYGVQFHPEMINLEHIESWLSDEIGQTEMNDPDQGFSKEIIIQHSKANLQKFSRLSFEIFSNFLSLSEVIKHR